MNEKEIVLAHRESRCLRPLRLRFLRKSFEIYYDTYLIVRDLIDCYLNAFLPTNQRFTA